MVDAFGDVYLSLRGVDRADPTATAMTLYVDAITAGGQAMLIVRTGVAQTTATGSGAIDVAGGATRVHSGATRSRTPATSGATTTRTRPSTTPAPAAAGRRPTPRRPTDAGTPIATTVSIGQRNVVLDRVQVPGVGGEHYAAADRHRTAVTRCSRRGASRVRRASSPHGMVLYDTVGATDPNANDIPPYVSLTGFINPDRYRLTPYGRLDANVGGDIFLTATGNVTVGSVESRWGDVTIKAGGKIGAPVGPAPLLRGLAALALLPPAAAESCGVRGINVTLESQQIGTPDNFIEVCLRNDRPTTGGLTATATSAIFINEPEGDLRLRSATVTTPDLTLVNDLTLTTTNGSILDFDADADVDVKGNKIVLAARGANKEIGDVSDQLEIDSSTAGVRSGWVYAHADYVILLTEVSGPMLVLGAQSDIWGGHPEHPRHHRTRSHRRRRRLSVPRRDNRVAGGRLRHRDPGSRHHRGAAGAGRPARRCLGEWGRHPPRRRRHQGSGRHEHLGNDPGASAFRSTRGMPTSRAGWPTWPDRSASPPPASARRHRASL